LVDGVSLTTSGKSPPEVQHQPKDNELHRLLVSEHISQCVHFLERPSAAARNAG